MKDTAYRNYLLVVLLVILAFNSVDRLALGLVLQDIKADLHLSDTQLGLLSGMAFALFYSIMGIPIARWADRGNRVTIISITTVLWSFMVLLCCLAGNFLQLLLIRVGVAVGEAGCIPPANSLIADYFTRAERPRAFATYMLGGPLSVLIGYFLAGWLNEFYGWRNTFLILGLPGVGLAALAWCTLREPRSPKLWSRASGAFATTAFSQPRTEVRSPSQTSLREVCVTLWANTTFRHLLLSFSVVYFFGSGMGQWQPAFLIRSYQLETGVLGGWLALIYGLGGLAGTYLGGVLASRHAANNERLQFQMMAVANVTFGLLSAFIYLSTSKYLAFGLMALAAVGGATTNGPLFAAIQTLVPQRIRAVSIAIIYLVGNLIGAGLGPWVVGALSDALRPLVGEESLRYVLLALCPGYIWGGWHLWKASRTVTRDLEAMQTSHNSAYEKGCGALSASVKSSSAGLVATALPASTVTRKRHGKRYPRD
jgi:MFS family permease